MAQIETNTVSAWRIDCIPTDGPVVFRVAERRYSEWWNGCIPSGGPVGIPSGGLMVFPVGVPHGFRHIPVFKRHRVYVYYSKQHEKYDRPLLQPQGSTVYFSYP